MNWIDLQIDLETAGLPPDGALLSIGAVFFDLDHFRLFAKLVNCQLRNYGPQPSAERAFTRIICKLAFLIAFGINPKTVKLSPDRACKVFGVFII